MTFDELLEGDYYRSEFEKRVQERLNIENSHPDVKGEEQTMDGIVQNQADSRKPKSGRSHEEESEQRASAVSHGGGSLFFLRMPTGVFSAVRSFHFVY